MFTYPAYKQLQQRLNTIAPAFYYIRQYQPGKGNINYVAPAIYIEMPKDSTRQYYGRGTRVIKNAIIKIHYISNAPYKSHVNSVQDAFLDQHNNALHQINALMEQTVLYKEDGSLLTQKILPQGSDELNFIDQKVYSILMYSTEIYL